MKFEELLKTVGSDPVFETGLLLAGDVNPNDVRRQLSRWVQAGRLVGLRRGLYALAPPFRKTQAHPFLIANWLRPGSYVSLQSALAYFGMIPEYVPVTTSVGLTHPRGWQTPLGHYEFRQLQADLLFGSEPETVLDRQIAYVATPEKALLDLIYLTPDGDSFQYLEELRLQNLDRMQPEQVQRLAERSRKPKLLRAADRIRQIAEAEAEAYETL